MIGIDEAGRGPLAGPVAVGIVKIPDTFDRKFFKDIRDSKKLSAVSRREWLRRAKAKGGVVLAVSMVSERIIDRRGITFAIQLAIKRCLHKVEAGLEDRILLDGSLRAPKVYINQRTIIGGDDRIKIISLASICAKVARDRRMTRLAKKFPEYGFHIHKGYGTRAHYQALRKHGLSPIHRKSFLKEYN